MLYSSVCLTGNGVIRHCSCSPGTEGLLGLGVFSFKTGMSLNPLAMEETYRMVRVLLVIIS